MARIPYPDPAALSPLQLESWNSGLNVGKLTAYLPDDVLVGFRAVGKSVLTNTTLDPILREMAIVRVGYLSNAPYEIHQHVQYSRKIGMPEDKLAALAQGSQAAIFSAAEKALLTFVEELVLNVRPSDATLAALREHLSIPEILTLIVSAGLYMTISRMLETGGVDLDADGVVVDPSRT